MYITKPAALAMILCLAACTKGGQSTPQFTRDGMQQTLSYRCAQGRLDVEYARMGGADSATLMLEDGHKVLTRSQTHRFELEDWQWQGAQDGREYTLLRDGQVVFDQCKSSRGHSAGKQDDEGAGTLRLQLNKAFR